jgi:hypothetical protein
MSRIRIIGLALVAVFAMSAVAVSSASAAKPFFTVEKVKFSSKGGSAVLSAAGNEVKCESSENKGATVGAGPEAKKVEKVTVVFKGCKKGAENCQSGTTAGEIKTGVLAGVLGYNKGGKATPSVGLQLTPGSGEKFVKFKCGGLSVEVSGCAQGKVEPLNTLSTEGKLLYSKPNLTEFEPGEGKNPCQLKAFGFLGAEEETSSTITFEKAEKIEA